MNIVQIKIGLLQNGLILIWRKRHFWKNEPIRELSYMHHRIPGDWFDAIKFKSTIFTKQSQILAKARPPCLSEVFLVITSRSRRYARFQIKRDADALFISAKGDGAVK